VAENSSEKDVHIVRRAFMSIMDLRIYANGVDGRIMGKSVLIVLFMCIGMGVDRNADGVERKFMEQVAERIPWDYTSGNENE